jgi:hypothetical protein
VFLQRGQEGLANISSVEVPLGRAGAPTALERGGHFLVAGQPVVNIR